MCETSSSIQGTFDTQCAFVLDTLALTRSSWAFVTGRNERQGIWLMTSNSRWLSSRISPLIRKTYLESLYTSKFLHSLRSCHNDNNDKVSTTVHPHPSDNKLFSNIMANVASNGRSILSLPSNIRLQILLEVQPRHYRNSHSSRCRPFVFANSNQPLWHLLVMIDSQEKWSTPLTLRESRSFAQESHYKMWSYY